MRADSDGLRQRHIGLERKTSVSVRLVQRTTPIEQFRLERDDLAIAGPDKNVGNSGAVVPFGNAFNLAPWRRAAVEVGNDSAN